MLKELSIRNRSYRKFDESAKIDRDLLVDLVDTARYAASSVNIQPLKYYITNDPDTCAFLRANTGWARLLKDYDGPAEGECPTAYIIVCVDKSIAPNIERFSVDIGISAQTIMLAAIEKGLGGCMIKNFVNEDVASGLKLPEEIYPYLILALGIPAEEIILEDAPAGEKKTPYYRDAENRHHVPKRTTEELIVKI